MNYDNCGNKKYFPERIFFSIHTITIKQRNAHQYPPLRGHFLVFETVVNSITEKKRELEENAPCFIK
jgi:hypothetical protein